MTIPTNEPDDPTSELAKLIVRAAIPETINTDTLRIGFVTGVNPIRLQYPGDTAPMAHTPLTTCAVSVGDQVLTTSIARRVIVLGVVNAARGRGVVFSAAGTTYGDVDAGAGLGFGDVAFTPEVGRLYRVTWHSPLSYANVSNLVAEAAIKYTTDGSRPLRNSANLRSRQYHIPLVGFFVDTPTIVCQFSVSSAPANPWRFLGTLVKISGGTLMTRADGGQAPVPWWEIEDTGSTATVAGNAVTANNGL
jgi:hypothetical protein